MTTAQRRAAWGIKELKAAKAAMLAALKADARVSALHAGDALFYFNNCPRHVGPRYRINAVFRIFSASAGLGESYDAAIAILRDLLETMATD